MYYERINDKSLERMIEGLCFDYERRKREIAEDKLPKRVLIEYKFLNGKIMEAAIEIVGHIDSEVMIYDIGMRRGYAKSPINRFSEIHYKMLKAKIKLNIAKKLLLL